MQTFTLFLLGVWCASMPTFLSRLCLLSWKIYPVKVTLLVHGLVMRKVFTIAQWKMYLALCQIRCKPCTSIKQLTLFVPLEGPPLTPFFACTDSCLGCCAPGDIQQDMFMLNSNKTSGSLEHKAQVSSNVDSIAFCHYTTDQMMMYYHVMEYDTAKLV